jgi:hypothetical protein
MTDTPVNFASLATGVEIAEGLAELWTSDYLIERIGEQSISVAVTPNGYNAKAYF